MGEWKKSCCMLCGQNCGLDLLVENNRITKVNPSKENVRSKGYVCRKGLNVAEYHHHADRLTHPLKKTKNGFEKISWEQATKEISQRLKPIIDQYGPKSFALMGGGGQGCQFDFFFAVQFVRALGSKYHYNALAQELTGHFWIFGRAFGIQNGFFLPDKANTDMLIAIGWNAMESHQMPRAPVVMKEFSENPDKLLVVIDPRKSKTAQIADIHIAVRPGSDALFLKSLIAMIVDKGLEDRKYLNKHVSGWQQIRPWFENFDYKKALSVCDVPYEQAEKLCQLLATRKWSTHAEMGVLMNRHSTATSYLQVTLMAICGRLMVPGGNIIPPKMVGFGFNTDERNKTNWRTQTTDYPAIDGFHPPNVLPEEILSEHPERIRAVLTCSSNPLRSYADTTAYEKAFKKLDLLVTIELSMTETAQLADYVLPARSGFEGWDATFFPMTHPESYFHLREPAVKPEGERLEAGEIFTRLADDLGLVPDLPESLYAAAKKDRFAYALELAVYIHKNPEALRRILFIMAKTLGKEMGSTHKATLWAVIHLMLISYKKPNGELMQPADVFASVVHSEESMELLPNLPKWIGKSFFSKFVYTMSIFLRLRPSEFFWEHRRQGYPLSQSMISTFSPVKLMKIIFYMIKKRSYIPLMQLAPFFAITERLFQAILDHPEGLMISKAHPDGFKKLHTKDNKVCVHIPEIKDWIDSLTPESEEKELSPNPDFPLILNAGSHMRANANTLMRNPAWNKKIRSCTLLINPMDADHLGLKDGQMALITTEAGKEQVEIEVTKNARKGQVVLPHGFGLNYNGTTFGANANRLAKNTNRDRLAGTPYHRYVPCRVEGV